MLTAQPEPVPKDPRVTGEEPDGDQQPGADDRQPTRSPTRQCAREPVEYVELLTLMGDPFDDRGLQLRRTPPRGFGRFKLKRRDQVGVDVMPLFDEQRHFDQRLFLGEQRRGEAAVTPGDQRRGQHEHNDALGDTQLEPHVERPEDAQRDDDRDRHRAPRRHPARRMTSAMERRQLAAKRRESRGDSRHGGTPELAGVGDLSFVRLDQLESFTREPFAEHQGHDQAEPQRRGPQRVVARDRADCAVPRMSSASRSALVNS